MSEQKKRYTAQEMRDMACHLIDICDTENECNEYRNTIGSFGLFDCESALRQAADAEEENARLKARLEAVVKECENCFMRVELFRVKMISVADMTRRHNADINDILRAARGDGGAE